MNYQPRPEELPLDERPLKGVTLKLWITSLTIVAAGVAAWVHSEGRTSENEAKIADIVADQNLRRATESRDHDLLIRMNGKLDELIASRGGKSSRALAAIPPSIGQNDDND